jgi:hypothetical protein
MIETKKVRITTQLGRCLEKPLVVHLVIKVSAFYGTPKFISVLTKLTENKRERKQVWERANSVTILAPSLSFV